MHGITLYLLQRVLCCVGFRLLNSGLGVSVVLQEGCISLPKYIIRSGNPPIENAYDRNISFVRMSLRSLYCAENVGFFQQVSTRIYPLAYIDTSFYSAVFWGDLGLF